MKKMAKKTDFEYRCFLCRKQDDKARTYTRSYDLILHMVNTHRKFPVDAKHNAYYAADGSDLRDATRDEIEKYRLAAAHKRRKPEAESSCEKSENATTTYPGGRVDTTRTRRDDDRGRSGYTAHTRDVERRTSSHDQDWKTGRNLSRDSKRGRETATRDSSRADTSRHQEKRDAGGRSSDRERKTGESAEVTDDDERDRRKMEEIMRRMEERKVAKKSELAKRATEDAKVLTVAVDPKGSKERRPETEDASEVERAAAGPPRALKKAVTEKKKAVTEKEKVVTAESKQRKDARKWASGEVSDTAVVTQSTGENLSRRQRGVKKIAEKKPTESAEVAQATYMQDFVASQYPPMDGSISSTVRLGRAFVSGALGRRTDDPKLFDAAVNVTDCSVRLSTTGDLSSP